MKLGWRLLIVIGAGLVGCSQPYRGFTDSSVDMDAALEAGDAGRDVIRGDASIVYDGVIPPHPDVIPPDDACAAVSAMGTVERQPVDIIWMVDNSSSMQPAVEAVTAGLNNFAATVGNRGLDYRVIMLSLRSATNPITVGGSDRYGVCIPQPLSGDSSCGNGIRFFQSSMDIRSTQLLEQFMGTLGQTAGYRAGEARGGEAWAPYLRANATKTIVMVTDDNSRLSASDFEAFPGGTNPFNSNTLPPGILDPSWNGLFDHYTFDALYGFGSDTDPGVLCTYPDRSMPASSGSTYTTLVARTMGARAHICDGAPAWQPFFDSIATAVEHTSRISCDFAVPVPMPGYLIDPNRVNVVLSGTTNTMLGKVANQAACGANGGWYYDNDLSPTRIFLCPSSCDRAQMQVNQNNSGVQVQFGCQTVPG